MSDHPGSDEAAALRARRRAAARRHHPDRGGDPEEFRRAMAAAEEPAASPAPVERPVEEDVGPAVVPGHRAITAAAVLAAGGVRLVGGLRARLARSWPGSRR